LLIEQYQQSLGLKANLLPHDAGCIQWLADGSISVNVLNLLDAIAHLVIPQITYLYGVHRLACHRLYRLHVVAPL
jgi:hypothetical protein